MSLAGFPPGAVLIAGALALPFAAPRIRTALLVALPLAALTLVWLTPDGASGAWRLFEFQMLAVNSDPLARLFATVFAIMTLAGGVYSLGCKSVLELTAAYVYAGSAIGVVMAGDLVTVFVFWEAMAVASTLVVLSAGTETFVWFALMAASAGVFLHAGIKLPWFVFFQKDSGLRPPDPPWNMRASMITLSAICIGLGVFPQPLYALLPYPVDYVPYTLAHVINMLQLLLFSGLAFFVLLPMMKRTLTISLDFDWFYRVFATRAGQVLGDGLGQAGAAVAGGASGSIKHLTRRAAELLGANGRFAPLPRSNRTVFSVLMLLLATLAFGAWAS